MVLPVPALPTRVTSFTSSASSRSRAQCCSLLRGRMPQTPSRILRSGISLPLAASYRPSAVCDGLSGSRSSTYWLGSTSALSSGQRPLRVERVHLGAGDLHLGHPRIELVDVDAAGLVVHGLQAQGVGAQPQVDVLGDEDGLVVGVALAHVEGHAQDQVVGDLALAQGGAGPTAARPPPAAARRWAAGAPSDRRCAARPEAVQHARHLAGVAPALRGLLLELVDLLEDEDRDHHLVVLELQDRAGVVDQDVGVENEVLRHGGKLIDITMTAPLDGRRHVSPGSPRAGHATRRPGQGLAARL